METLEKFVDERVLSCDEFVAKHQHPFLLIGSSSQMDKKSFAVATQVKGLGKEEMQRLMDLNRMEEKGWSLDHSVLNYALVSISKKNINPFKDQISLGRTTLSDVVISDSHISKRHACFTYHQDKQQFFLTDLGSTNGTFINDVELEPRKEYPLNYGDTIRFGQFSAQFLKNTQVWNILQKAIVRVP